ncbi:MAG: MlaD family protein [candidate division WOR-3 bacterium]
MSRSVREVVVAGFVVACIGLGVVAFFWFSGRLESSRRRSVAVMFDDVTGLRVGDPVEVMGVPRGKVLALELAGQRVRCVVGLDRDVELTEDSRIAIRSVSYLGSDRYLMVTIGKGPAAPADMVFEGHNEALNLEETFLRLDRMLAGFDPSALGRGVEDRARELLSGIAAEVAQLGRRFDRFSTGFESTGRALERVAAGLDSLSGLLADSSSAGRLLKSDELYQEIRQTNEALQALIADMRQNPRRYFRITVF